QEGATEGEGAQQTGRSLVDEPPDQTAHRHGLPERSSRRGSEEQQHEPGSSDERVIGKENRAGQAGDGSLGLQQRPGQQNAGLPTLSHLQRVVFRTCPLPRKGRWPGRRCPNLTVYAFSQPEARTVQQHPPQPCP
ncbi:trinucleotide repeat-containing protein 6C-like, partial [Arapaima gigas]